MQFDDVVILLPCYSIEDLPLEWSPEEANELLSAWSAAYHPAVLASAGRIVRWVRAGEPPADTAAKLIMLPRCSESRLPSDWLDRANDTGASVIRNRADRTEMIAAILDYLGPDLAKLDPGLTGDFLALGFCHLEIELLTRQLRYMSNLDTDRFQREAVAGAKKAMEGDHQAAREHVQRAFDLLTESREYYYPVEAHLLDWTLVAATTLGDSLRAEMAGKAPVNLLLSGETVERMARDEPDTLAALKAALEQGTASIAGGEFREQELPLLTVEGILRQLKRGQEAYERHLGRRLTIFARRRFGLTPSLPLILRALGFAGAAHFTLDDGRFPSGNQSKIRWEGADGTTIEALARLPVDASRPGSFFKLPETLGGTMDLDHAATAVFAHWPGHACAWYGDLRRMAAYSPVLGRFASLTGYFEKTQNSGQSKRYTADDYRSPYLRQAVANGEADPISRWARYYRRTVAAETLRTLEALNAILRGQVPRKTNADEFLRETDDALAVPADDRAQLESRIADCLQQTAEQFAAGLASPDGAAACYLAVNPHSFTRRMHIDLPSLDRPPAVEGAVWRSAEHDGRAQAVVDLPPMGFVRIAAGSGTVAAPKPAARKFRKADKPEPPLAEPYVLRNEYFEAVLDPTTGAIRSLSDYSFRGKRIAQQLALRLPGRYGTGEIWEEEGHERDYSVMAADDISVSAGPLAGRITSRGRLLDRDGRRLAGFQQTMTVCRGSRVLELEVELDPLEQPDADPWNSYYAMRFAWGDATAEIYRSVGMMSRQTEATLVESPLFVEIRSGKKQTTLLTGGLPYHRRFGLRKLDTLLVVRGETARTFRLGIGIDLGYPVPAAMDFLAPQCVVEAGLPPEISSGWLFHIENRNIVATSWQTLEAEGKLAGFRARLLETEGREGRVGLRSFRPVESARSVDFTGGNPRELSAEADRVTMDVKAHEWTEVEVRLRS
ncbi:MAG: hypothetical protein HUU20_13665 [Pirellulales bacterium]|nr:hypothetical protein [Pirellulales bacterium]